MAGTYFRHGIVTKGLTPMHRFYAPDAASSGLAVQLPASEANQLRAVLRLRPGASVCVFDGRGGEYEARVDKVERNGVTLRTLERRQPAPEPTVNLKLAMSILKGRAMDAVVRDATMLGASEIQPIVTTHSHATPTTIGLNRVVSRWQAIAVSSAKQCRRAVVPTIKPVAPLKRFLEQPSSPLNLFLVEPTLQVPYESLRVLAGRSVPSAATVSIGPEGGWSADEIRMAVTAGFTLITLGPRTLRADATPVVALSVLQYLWEEL